ncbi:hypothetical protein C8R48DRAFT_615160 [Suillus tomentosus]|nr:hypothetical protein C8R48DRAFT_615160 [Suillus tomentosus]
MQTAQGTKNLNRGITECIQRRGVSTEGPNAKGAQQTLSGSISKYTPEAHCALIAMRCAVNRRPFRSVADPLYIEEVRLLRPDVIVPSPRTVSRDINEDFLRVSPTSTNNNFLAAQVFI